MQSVLDLPAPIKRGDKPAAFITFAASAIPTGEVTAITVRRYDNGETLRFTGRAAWALGKLAAAGREGITSLTSAGPRLADYCFKLRRAGLEIETIHETHGGVFAGTHGKYVLRTPIHVLEIKEAGERT